MIEQKRFKPPLRKISTTLEESVYQECKTRRMPWNELIIRGLQHTKGFPALIERLNSQEKALDKLNRIIVRQSDRIGLLEGALEKIKPGINIRNLFKKR